MEREICFPESVIKVRGRVDPAMARFGHDPRSEYVERFWLPILGPSSLLLVRRLSAELDERPQGFEVATVELAAELGLGMKGGKHGPFWRSLERCCNFGTARRNGPELVVRRHLPALTPRQIGRLSGSLQQAHAECAGPVAA